MIIKLHALMGWTDPALITNASSAIGDFSFSMSPCNGCGYLAYSSTGGGSVGGVYLKNTTSGASSWTLNNYLSTESIDAKSPSVSGRNGYSFTAWLENNSGTYNVLFRRGTEGAYKISGSGNCSSVNLFAGSGEAVHAVWAEGGIIFYRKGFNNGVNWSDVKMVGSSPSDKPFVLESGSSLYVLWQGGAGTFVKYSKSEDGGLTWSTEANISSAGTGGLSGTVDTAGNIYIVWEQGSKIYFRKCVFSGWAMEKTISTNTAGTAGYPSVTADSDGIIYAVWTDNRTGVYKMYSSQSADEGVTFSQETELSALSGAGKIIITSYKKNLRLFWKDLGQVYYRVKDTSAPLQVQITTPTHQSGRGTSNNNCPVFYLATADNEGGTGVFGVSYVFDSLSGTIPPSAVNLVGANSVSFPKTANGKWYLHVKAVDLLGNWGIVSHAMVEINNTSLLPFEEAWCAPNPVKTGTSKLRYFTAEAAQVAVTVYNEAGEKIITMEQDAVTGVNEITGLAGDNWANGVYFIKVTAKSVSGGSSSTVTKKLVLLR